MIEVTHTRIHYCNGDNIVKAEKMENVLTFVDHDQLEAYRRSRESELQAEQKTDVQVHLAFTYKTI